MDVAAETYRRLVKLAEASPFSYVEVRPKDLAGGDRRLARRAADILRMIGRPVWRGGGYVYRIWKPIPPFDVWAEAWRGSSGEYKIISVHLPEKWLVWIGELVRSGVYPTRSHVIRAALDEMLEKYRRGGLAQKRGEGGRI